MHGLFRLSARDRREGAVLVNLAGLFMISGPMLKFALVGCGNMSHWHAQQLQKIPSVQVVAVVDPLPQRTKEIKEKYFPNAVELKDYEAF